MGSQDIKNMAETNVTDLQAQALPDYLLNAKGLLTGAMPSLVIGEKGTQTVSEGGKVRHYYHGSLATWDSFESDALLFWSDKRMVDALLRCAHLPIALDPEIEKLNPSAMTVERIQCGGEITLSARFYSNALAPVIHCIETMANVSDFLPAKVIFSDAWIRDPENRVTGQLPDVVGKLQIEADAQVRLVGEIKFCETVDLRVMIDGFIERTRTDFCHILGQIVNYMLGHRLKYAFLSNYRDTTFLYLTETFDGQGKPIPRVYCSRMINFEDTVDEGKRKVSVRLALLYLIHKTFSQKDDDWRISQETLKLTKGWIQLYPPSRQSFATPLRHKNIPHVGQSSNEPEGNQDAMIAGPRDKDDAQKRRGAISTHFRKIFDSGSESPHVPETPSRAPQMLEPETPDDILGRLDMFTTPLPVPSYEASRANLRERLRAQTGQNPEDGGLAIVIDKIADLDVEDQNGTSSSRSSSEAEPAMPSDG